MLDRLRRVVELMRKLLLTGFVLLIPQYRSLLRLVCAILLSVAHLVLLHAADPYTQRSTAAVAVGTSMTLLCTLLAALLITLQDSSAFYGIDAFSLTVAILSFNVGVLAIACILLAHQLNVASRSLATVRVRATGQSPTLSLANRKKWHLFLSHVWANQDVVGMIKRQLQLLVPGVQVFLDVDDLASVDALEEYVQASQTLLVLLGKETYCMPLGP